MVPILNSIPFNVFKRLVCTDVRCEFSFLPDAYKMRDRCETVVKSIISLEFDFGFALLNLTIYSIQWYNVEIN